MTSHESELFHAILAELRTIRTLLLLQTNAFQSHREARAQIEQTIDQADNLRRAVGDIGMPAAPFTLTSLHRCEVCGRPAVNLVRDAIDTTPPDAVAATFTPGPIHWYCNQHSRPIATIERDGAKHIDPFDLNFHFGIMPVGVDATQNGA